MSDCELHVIPGRMGKLKFKVSEEDVTRLVKSVLANYDPCKCHPGYDWTGRVVETHICPAHEFLHETDEPGRTLEWTVPHGPREVMGSLGNCVGRIDRLVFVRHTARKFLNQEFYVHGHTAPHCNPNIMPGWIWGFDRRADASSARKDLAEDFNW